MIASIRLCISFTASNTYVPPFINKSLSTKSNFCQPKEVGMCWSRSTDTMHLLPHFISKNVSKGVPVEETLMYNS